MGRSQRIMAALYYITTRQMVIKHKDLFAGSHMVWVDKPADKVLVKCHFGDEASELHWRSQPGVEPLPHPILENTVPIKHEHADLMARHGVQRGHSLRDVVHRVSHPYNPHGNVLMRLTVL